MSKTYKNGGYVKVTLDSSVGRDPNSKDKEAATFPYYVRINRQSWADLGLIKLEFETKEINGKPSKVMKKLDVNKPFFKAKHKAWKESIDKVNEEIESVLGKNRQSKRKMDCKRDAETGEIVSFVLREWKRNLDLPKSYGSSKESKTKTKPNVDVKPVQNTSKEAANLAAYSQQEATYSQQDVAALIGRLTQMVNA